MLSMRKRVGSSGHGCVRITARSWTGCTGCEVRYGWPTRPGPTGFGLARALADAQIDCVVAAPSKLIRPSGDRIKTDARDAAHLTRLLRLGEIPAGTEPEADVEAIRDLVRAREDARADLMRVRHRLSKLLLRQGRVYSGGQAWNGVHETWLRRERFDDPTPRQPSITISTQSCQRQRPGIDSTSRSSRSRLAAMVGPGRPAGLPTRDLGADRAGVDGGNR